MTASLRKDAKVITYSKAEAMRNEEIEEMREKTFSVPMDEAKKMSKQIIEWNQVGISGCIKDKGYDAIYEETSGYTVVVNAKEVVMKRTGV